MIAVCSHGGLARHCRRLRPGWMLSILGASDGLAWPLHEPRERHLRVACDDIQVPARGMVVPGRAHVEEMLAFLGRWDREAPLLVHCRAGTSRSTAAALLALALLNPGREQAAALLLRQRAPQARPSMVILRHGDDLLGCGGRLVAAAASMPEPRRARPQRPRPAAARAWLKQIPLKSDPDNDLAFRAGQNVVWIGFRADFAARRAIASLAGVPHGPRMIHSRQASIVAGFALLGAVIGVAIVLALAGPAWPALLRVGVVGALVGAVVAMAEMAERSSAFLARLRALPFAAFLAAKAALQLVVIVAAMAVARWLVPVDLVPLGEALAGGLPVALLAALAIAFCFEVDRLLGPGTLWRLAIGRYHAPRIEERAFLLLDLAGSTAIARQIGPERFLALLDHLLAAMSPAFLAHRAEVYRYVGDGIIVSWPLAEAVEDARILRCLEDAVRRMVAERPRVAARFGVAPAGRAALHCGPVAVGAVGDAKREIAFLGDTLNTAAKMEKAAGERGLSSVASRDLLDRLRLPPGFVARPLGPVELGGGGRPVELLELVLPPASPPRG
jgi:adenylate cyclase